VYQQPDLSGEFRVRDDGSVSLPLIGTVPAAGLKVGALERMVAERANTLSGRRLSVSIEVVEWRPVFVLGHVERPGPTPFVPGMTALKAIASVGGLFRLTAGGGAAVDLSREAARLGIANEERKQNLARLARLQAQMEGDRFLRPPQRLLTIESPQRAEEIIEREEEVLQQQTLSYDAEIRARDEMLLLVSEQIDAMLGQHVHTLTEIEIANKELARMENLVQRGLGRRGDLFTIQRIVAGLEADERELTARTARAKAELITAQRDRELLSIARQLELRREVNAVESALASNELVVAYSRRVIEDMTNLALEAEDENRIDRVDVEIVRESEAGVLVIEGGLNNKLCPGDVLKVTPYSDY